jgi:hypothetical protein
VFTRSWKSLVSRSLKSIEAVASSRLMSTLSSGMRIVQNRPLGATPGL